MEMSLNVVRAIYFSCEIIIFLGLFFFKAARMCVHGIGSVYDWCTLVIKKQVSVREGIIIKYTVAPFESLAAAD